jgi:hypothetical protein
VIAFFDTEFVQSPLQLASIAVVRDDGEELYLVAPKPRIPTSNWYFRRKVWKHIKDEPKHPLPWIAAEVRRILRGVTLLVSRDGGSDQKIIEQLVPGHGIPFLDLQREWIDLGKPKLPPRPSRHHALDDARYHRDIFDCLFNYPPVPALAAVA